MKEIVQIQIKNTASREHFKHKNSIPEFVNWHLQRHSEDIGLINEYLIVEILKMN